MVDSEGESDRTECEERAPGCLLLHAAAMGGHDGMIRPLLDARSDPNQKDADGFTALEWARIMGRHATVAALEDYCRGTV